MLAIIDNIAGRPVYEGVSPPAEESAPFEQ
jgi:hypothetical protein